MSSRTAPRRGRPRPLRAMRRAAAWLLLGLTVGGWIYGIASLWEVRQLLAKGGTGGGSGSPTPVHGFTPPVSLLKPVRGLDYGAAENFTKLLRQDYPEYEVLFAVADPADPAVALIRSLAHTNPAVPVRLLVSSRERPNPKVALLEELAAAADHDVLVLGDSDARAEPDYLRRVVGPLAEPGVGLVTCPYRASHADTLAARLQALYLGVGYLPAVALARVVLRMRFALGATIALRKDTLDRIGGFAAVADYLADDYQLGARTAAAGLQVRMAPYVVEIPLGPLSLGAVWRSEVRWARCTRVSRPVEYPGLLFTLPVPLSILWAVLQRRKVAWTWCIPGFSLLLRGVVAWQVTGYTGDTELRRWLPLLPLRDAFTSLVLIAAAYGREVEWRGDHYRVGTDGRMTRVERPAPPPSSSSRSQGHS